MGTIDSTMAKGDDNSDNLDRIEMLQSKTIDGSITEAERDELSNTQNRLTLDSDK